jgi:hypothetical protein
MKSRLLLLATALCLMVPQALAQSKVPSLINYQGNVRNAAGTAIGAGTAVNRTVTFRFYKNPTSILAADRLWSESQTVTILDGNFNVLIGQGTPVSGEANAVTPFANVFGQSTAVYLGVTVDDGNSATVDAEISPRQQLVTGAFAFRATVAESVDNLAITSSMLATSSVTTNQLGSAAVTTAKIANDAVTSLQILNGAIQEAKLATGAVTSAKILDGTIVSADIAADTITAGNIAPGAVASSEILDGSIVATDIADGTISTAKIADATVTTAKIADATVTTAKIADANVTTAKIADANVTTAKIANSGITAAKLSGAQTGTAPIYGCRAWVNFDGTRDTTGAVSTASTARLIRASGNVTSVVRNLTGDYTIYFTTSMPDANYSAVHGGAADQSSTDAGGAFARLILHYTKTSATYRLKTRSAAGSSSGGPVDFDEVNVAIFR